MWRSSSNYFVEKFSILVLRGGAFDERWVGCDFGLAAPLFLFWRAGLGSPWAVAQKLSFCEIVWFDSLAPVTLSLNISPRSKPVQNAERTERTDFFRPPFKIWDLFWTAVQNSQLFNFKLNGPVQKKIRPFSIFHFAHPWWHPKSLEWNYFVEGLR